MRRLWISITTLLIISLGAFAQEEDPEPFGQGYCITMEMDSALRASNPSIGSLDEFEENFQQEIARYSARLSSGRVTQEVITIPVILHVIHNGEAKGEGPNMSKAQADSQIEAMNEHFRKIGSGANDNPVGADIEIEFAPALYDPQGNRMEEPGINRVDAGQDGWVQSEIENNLKPSTIWDPNRYFNIWTVKFGDEESGLLGYAQFPSMSGLEGMPEVGGLASTDGIVMNYVTYGTTSNVPFPYNGGKTVSHEVGHWLGLRHIWGDGLCGVDDYCDDTPNSRKRRWSSALLGCPTDNECGDGDRPVDNYMDYSDDPCRNTFTNDQKTRMRTVMDVSPRRKELLSSTVHEEREAPFAFFISDKTSGCEGLVISFTDQSTNSPSSWLWTITDEDGTEREFDNQNPNIAFASHGHYDVRLIASNAAGADTLLRSNYVSIISKDAVTSIDEDFEDSGQAELNWFFYNPDADRTFEFAAFSANGEGAQCVKMDNYSREDDPSTTMDALVSLPLDFSNAQNPYLQFDHAYARLSEGFADTLALAYSTDCGENFHMLWSKGGKDLATAEPTDQAFEPTDQQWSNNQLSLAALKGMQQVHLAFVNVSGWGNNLYLDNIQVADLVGNAAPEPVTIWTSDTLICTGEFVRFEDRSPEYPTEWLWTFEGGTPATSTEQNPTVFYETAGKFDVTLKATNSVGSSTEVFDTLITVISLPEQVAIESDKASYCPGDSVTLTGSGAESYVWFDERSVYPATEENPYTFQVFVSRNYYLLGINEIGCRDTASIMINVDEGVNTQVTPKDTLVCAGSPIVFTATGGESYMWITKNDTISTEATVEVSPESSAVLGVVGSASAGCPGFDYAQISVNKNPVATVEQDDLVLVASEAEAYQWYQDETAIPDATERAYTAETSGSYHVVVEDANGCKDASEPVSIEIITGLDELTLLMGISIYPNPTSGRLSIQVVSDKIGKFEYQVADISGKIIQFGNFEKSSELHYVELDIAAKSGLYFLKINDGDDSAYVKIIKN